MPWGLAACPNQASVDLVLCMQGGVFSLHGPSLKKKNCMAHVGQVYHDGIWLGGQRTDGHRLQCISRPPVPQAAAPQPGLMVKSKLRVPVLPNSPKGIWHCSVLSVWSGLATKHDRPALVGPGRGLGHQINHTLYELC